MMLQRFLRVVVALAPLVLAPLAAAQSFVDSFETPAWHCPAPPEGFVEEQKSWQQVFGPDYSYPNTWGDFYPVGSWTLAGRRYNPRVSTTGKYLSIPFIGSGSPMQLQWNSAKPVSGYSPARFTDAVYVTISTCPGDFRLTWPFQYFSPDPLRDPNFVTQCRSTNTSEALMAYAPSASGAFFCPVEKDQLYFINIVFGDALSGLDPAVTGCSTADGICEISVKNRPTL